MAQLKLPALEHRGMTWRSRYWPLTGRPVLGTRRHQRPMAGARGTVNGTEESGCLPIQTPGLSWRPRARGPQCPCSRHCLCRFCSVSTGRKLAEEHAAVLAQLASRITAIINVGSGAGEDPRTKAGSGAIRFSEAHSFSKLEAPLHSKFCALSKYRLNWTPACT